MGGGHSFECYSELMTRVGSTPTLSVLNNIDKGRGMRKIILFVAGVVIESILILFLVKAYNENITLQTEAFNLRNELDLLQNETSRSGGLEVTTENAPRVEYVTETFDSFPLPDNRYLRQSSPFGVRYSPITGEKVTHLGWDLCGIAKSEVHVVADGTVTDVWIPKGTRINGITYKGHPSRDGYIVVDHGDYSTTYSHLSTTYIYNIGVKVKAGDIIGRTGSGGVATGDHLHFEVIENKSGSFVNPTFFFPLMEIDKLGYITFVDELEFFTSDYEEEVNDN
jgi:murein DD-endopeptidase MepM/ murein hydrolase activator NlpD